MNLKKKFAFSSAFASLLITTLAPLTATAVPTNGNVGKSIPIATSQSAKTFWTPKKLREAVPLDVIRSNSPRAVSQITLPSGPTVSAPSGGPSITRLQKLSQPLSTEKQVSPLGYSYPFPFTRYSVRLSNYEQFPEATVGKLFFTQGGRNFVCSASAVNSTNLRLIWTAGHCVSNGAGTFSTNVIFIPAYKPGTSQPEPYGRWSACGLYTTSAWHSGGDLAQDLGAIQACDINGTRLHNVTGYLGYLANASRNQHWHPFGYPQAAPFDGTKMIACAASHAVDDSGTPNPIGIGCDTTGGTSGGPWMVNYSPDTGGNANLINGVNSYKYGNQPNAIYSPYFGDAFVSLRDYAIAGGS